MTMRPLCQNQLGALDSIEVIVQDYFSFILGMQIEVDMPQLKLIEPQ